jgi:hypothetical protein
MNGPYQIEDDYLIGPGQKIELCSLTDLKIVDLLNEAHTEGQYNLQLSIRAAIQHAIRALHAISILTGGSSHELQAAELEKFLEKSL